MKDTTDFKQIILDLMNKDLSLRAMAARTHIDVSTLSRILHDQRKTVMYDNGARLVALHKEVCADA